MDRFLSIVAGAPVSYAVYSSLSFLGRRTGGELPGAWFVRALGAAGHSPAAVRQTLYRMERSGELHSRRKGRTRLYRLGPLAAVEADAGWSKLLDPPPPAWDGQWTVVHLRFEVPERPIRERILSVLRAQGFGSLGPGLFIHPRDRGAAVVEALCRERGDARPFVLRGRRLGNDTDGAFAAATWDLDSLARRYTGFVRSYRGLLGRPAWAPEAAFVARFAVVFDYLEVAWSDPDLPGQLLPEDWPGHAARDLARRLYRTLLPPALRFGRSLLREVTGQAVSTAGQESS